MKARVMSVTANTLLFARLLLRDGQFLFWNFGFFTLLLVIFLGVLSGGDASVRVALTAAIIPVGLTANLLFSVGVGVAAAQERGVFRQYQAARLPIGELLASAAIARAGLVLAAAIAQMIAARVLFGVTWTGSPAAWIVVLVFGTATFTAVGLAIATRASSARAANRMANLVLIPLMTLGGASLPAAMMPDTWNRVRWLLPIAPVHDGLTAVLISGATLGALSPHLAVLALWAAAAILIGVRR